MPTILAIAFILGLQTPAGSHVDEIYAKHLAAVGGEDALSKLQTLSLDGTAEVPGQPLVSYTWEWKRPGKVRMSGRSGISFTIEGVDGSRAWSMWQEGIADDADLKASDRKRIAHHAEGAVSKLWNARAHGDTIELIEGNEAAEARELVLRVLRKGEPPFTVYLDPRTHLEIREEGTRVANDVAYEAVTTFSDYRSVGGLQIPFLIKTWPKDSTTVSTIRWATCKVNVELPDEIFVSPANRPISKP